MFGSFGELEPPGMEARRINRRCSLPGKVERRPGPISYALAEIAPRGL